MASVTVRGGAQGEADPDRVRLTLSLEARAAQADAALGDLAERSAALDRVLDGLGAALLLRRPSSVSVGPWSSRRGEEQGQVARRALTVECRADGPLGDLLARAVQQAGATVGGTQWTVQPDNPIHAELRRAAVLDARERAWVYAEAAGLRLGPVDWLAEPGLAPGPRDRRSAAEDMTFMAVGAERGGDFERVLELRPEPVPVAAAVEVSYALLPGPQGTDGGNYL